MLMLHYCEASGDFALSQVTYDVGTTERIPRSIVNAKADGKKSAVRARKRARARSSRLAGNGRRMRVILQGGSV